MQMTSEFVGTYLKLTPAKETAFNLEIGRIESPTQEQVMAIATSWMEKGTEQGLEQGCRVGELRVLPHLLATMLNFSAERT